MILLKFQMKANCVCARWEHVNKPLRRAEKSRSNGGLVKIENKTLIASGQMYLVISTTRVDHKFCEQRLNTLFARCIG